MRTRLIGTAAIAALALAACGGGSPQDDVADMVLEAAEDEGLDLEPECVREAAADLNDEDAQTILDAGPEGDPELSAAAEAVANRLFGCFDTDAFVDQLVAEMGGAEGIDVECLKQAFRSLDPATFEDDRVFATALQDCVELGG